MQLSRCLLGLLSMVSTILWLQGSVAVETGSLNLARRQHTATLLSDGRVLAAGGRNQRGLVWGEGEIWDPSTGIWTLAGSLSIPRFDHTATRLRDGRILVAGGWWSQALRSAEIFDPEAAEWSRLPDMHHRRSQHTATLLPDGMVLMAGGKDSEGEPIESVEIFDPATSIWYELAPLQTARFAHRALLGSRGEVTVLGGIGASSKMEQLDDPLSTWRQLPDLKTHHRPIIAEKLEKGQILVAGGFSRSAEIYRSGSWVSTQYPYFLLKNCRSLRLPDGRIFATGETDGYRLGYLFDSGISRWLEVDLGVEYDDVSHTMTLLQDGKVLIAGGSSGNQVTASAFTIDFPQLIFPHLVLGGGFELTLFVTNKGDGPWSGSAQLNSGDWPTNWPWFLDGHSQSGRSDFTIDLGPNETRKFVLSSSEGPLIGWLEIRSILPASSLATSFFYNYAVGGELEDSTGVSPVTGAFAVSFPVERSSSVNTGIAVRRTPGLVMFELYDETGVFLQRTSFQMDGALFFDEIFGGVPNDFIGSVRAFPVDSLDLFLTVLRQEVRTEQPLRFQLTSVPPDRSWHTPRSKHPEKHRITPAGSLNDARASHTATTLTDGRVLVAGGANASRLNTAELFDPVRSTWTRTANMHHPRVGHTATLLRDGTVLVVGGTAAPKTAEIYRSPNLRASSDVIWTETQSLTFEHVDHTATLLEDGRVLVAGGGSAVSEIYDPVLREWATAGVLQQERSKHTATLLKDGTVLLIGGHARSGSPLDGCEIFHPTSGTWNVSASLETARYGHSATLLSDGRVVVVGGLPNPGAATTSEVYTPARGWRTVQAPTYSRLGHSAVRLSDGGVLIAGGTSSGIVEVFDPGSETWHWVGIQKDPQVLQSLSILKDGGVLASGGIWTSARTDCELFRFTQRLYPHLVLGGGFEVVLLVANRGEEGWVGEAVLDGGSWPTDQAWQLDGEDRSGSTSFPIQLGPRETRKFRLSSVQGPFTGSFEIQSGQLLSNLATSFFYNYSDSSGLIDSVGVPAAEATYSSRFPVEQSPTVRTGVAIRSFEGNTGFLLFDQAGNYLRNTLLPLDGAKFIDEIFAGIPDRFVGSVAVAPAFGYTHLLVLRQEIIPGPELRFQITSVPAALE